MQRRESLWRGPLPPSGRAGAAWVDDEVSYAVAGEEVQQEIAAIDEALGRIAQGSYGTCLACGGPLGLQRIRAIPEARYCVACSGVGAPAE
jgi:RNA polymerase-binding transcription factor DksA